MSQLVRRTIREPLPSRRRSWTQHVTIGEAPDTLSIYLSFGEYDDGRLGEIWLDSAKPGTFVKGVLMALARMVSVALQSGVPVRELVHTLEGLNYPPQGTVVGEFTRVTHCSSVADWVAQEIEAAYGGKNHEPSVP